MSRALFIAALAVAGSMAGGCSILWGPDRDQIQPDGDGGPGDGGMDGGVDGGVDASVDGGDGGGCVPTEEVETQCTGGRDDDCDGYVDCFDSDCSSAMACCGSSVQWEPDTGNYVTAPWRQIPRTTTGDILRTTTSIDEFGPLGRPRALLFEDECAPIALGLDLDVSFEIDSRCSGCSDFAALALTPANDMVDGNRLLSEVAVVVTANGEAWVERAGSVLPDTVRTDLAAGSQISLRLQLRPGVDDTGRPVMLATVNVAQDGWPGDTELLNKRPLLIQDDLRGAGFCPSFGGVRGLLLAFEGEGNKVRVSSALEASQRQCSNPSFFEELELEGFEAELVDCSAEQLGEPSLVTYCVGCPTGRTWELWADTTDEERADDLGSLDDFYVCGARSSNLTTGWRVRTDGVDRDAIPDGIPDPPVLPAPTMTSVREPYVWARTEYPNSGGDLVVAWARRVEGGGDAHEIWVGELSATDADRAIAGTQRILSLEDVADSCDSLRDPALVPRTATPEEDGFHLLFTCEGVGAEPNAIGSAPLDWFEGRLRLDPEESVQPRVLTSALGSYASRGPFAPEPVAEIDGENMRLRLWFLARSLGGEVTLSFASGEGLATDGLPSLTPYPANPILHPDDPIFGDTPACTLGCYLNGVGVASTTDDFQIVVGRTVIGTPSNAHQLVGLRQRRPR